MMPDPAMPLGLYRLHWKSGVSSLAAVGRLYGGPPWYAPTTWTARDLIETVSTDWGRIERVELILREGEPELPALPELTYAETVVLLAETVVALLEIGIRIDAGKDVTKARVPALMRAAELAAICRLRSRVSRVVPAHLIHDLGEALHEAGLSRS